MENWKILNQDFAVEPIEKSEEHTLVTQGIEKNVLIIPGTFRICGKKIKSPKVAPLTLSPIFKDDKIIGYRSEYKEQAMSYQVKGLSRNSNNKAYHSLQDRQNLTL